MPVVIYQPATGFTLVDPAVAQQLKDRSPSAKTGLRLEPLPESKSSPAALEPQPEAWPLEIKEYDEPLGPALPSSNLNGEPGEAKISDKKGTPMATDSSSIARLIYEEFNKAGLDGAFALSNAAFESSLKPQIVNPATGAFGLFQFLPTTMAGLRKNYPELVDLKEGATPELQVRAAILLTKETIAYMKGKKDDLLIRYAWHLGPHLGKKLYLEGHVECPPGWFKLKSKLDPKYAAANGALVKHVIQFAKWVVKLAQDLRAQPTFDNIAALKNKAKAIA